MLEWIGMSLIFVGVFGSALTLLLWFQGQAAPPSQSEDSELLESRTNFFTENFAGALAEQVPMSSEGESEIAKELREAGYYSRHATMLYRAIRTLGLFVPFFIGLALSLLVPRPQMPIVLLCGLVISVLGFSLPRVIVNFQGRSRKAAIERGLPIAVDLIALGLSAGQGLNNAISRTVKEMETPYPILSSELAIVFGQAQLNTLPHAMDQFAWRVQVPEVQTLASVVTQASKLGTDIYPALLEFSTHMRTNLRQRADTQANRAGLLMLFPTILGLWLPTAVILVGPIFFEFRDRRQKAAEVVKERNVNQVLQPETAPEQ